MTDTENNQTTKDQEVDLHCLIREFCEGQKWAEQTWKDQPHIKPLFDFAREGKINEKKLEVVQRCLVRPLEVGCEVVTNNGKIHTIGKITYGDSVAESRNSFFRWKKEFPWEIEHAAMNPETDSILTVWWPNN